MRNYQVTGYRFLRTLDAYGFGGILADDMGLGKTLQVINGTKKNRKALLDEYKNYDVLITSYDLLKRDITEYEGKEFLYQIVDEAQYIKNHSTAVAKAVKCIASKTRYAEKNDFSLF